MKRLRPHSGSRWIAGAAAVSLAALSACPVIHAASCAGAAPVASACSSLPFADSIPVACFGYDGVLGTSMDLRLAGTTDAQAVRAERAILDEIDRLTSILSTRDGSSRIRQCMAGGSVDAPEIAELLGMYGQWSARTGGIITPHLAGLIELWKSAQAAGRLPGQREIDGALSRMDGADLQLLNIDALGKGYVIDRAVAIARDLAPAGLLDIGGDIRAWGEIGWRIGIADPENPAENAKPAAWFTMRNGAAATSGGYLRNYSIAGRKWSHIIDGRNGRSIDPMNCATVVAGDCVTANALSTAGCVLGPALGSDLAKQLGSRGFLLADASGAVSLGGGADSPIRPMAQAADAAKGNWPSGYQVSIGINLRQPGGRKAKRPYVAVWVENGDGKVVKTVELWGTNGKYIKDMRHWLRATAGDRSAINAVGRASRPIGQYTIVWDGTDDKGKPVSQGKYTIAVEINREHGRDVVERTALTCGDKAQSTKMKATGESDESTISYGPRGK